LAHILKEAIESEFSGFVEVFVSSDGISIPVGSNFLKRIEDALSDCIGALYLISSVSVKRNWINFELGAVWIRNVLNGRKNKGEIPVIPICHSGITPKTLPQPLSELNAINGNCAEDLRKTFSIIQKVVGGKGKLKTDFDTLAQKIAIFEQNYIESILKSNEYGKGIVSILKRDEVDNLIGDVPTRISKTKKELCVSANDGVYFLVSQSNIVETYLKNGHILNLLLDDPEVSSINEMLQKFDGRFPREDSFKISMAAILPQLDEWKKKYPGKFNCRLLPILPSIGFFITDPESESSTVKTELYVYNREQVGPITEYPVGTRPNLVINDYNWKRYFIDLWGKYWELGRTL
jgi:hypothetical protein